MSVVDLQRSPQNEKELLSWAFANRTEHERIRQRIQDLGGPNLISYQLEPINFDDIGNWLERHQAAHSDMEFATNVKSYDLQTVDFNDKAQFESWIAIHYQSHFDVNSVLKI